MEPLASRLGVGGLDSGIKTISSNLGFTLLPGVWLGCILNLSASTMEGTRVPPREEQMV